MLIPTPARPTPAPGEPNLTLPRTFWKDFGREHWDREPAVFRGLFAAHFPTLEELFAGLVEGSERALRGEFPPLRGLRFFIEHEDGPAGMPYYSVLFNLTPHFLPSREDRDAHAYVERVTRVLGGKRFGVVLNRAQAWHWGHWLQMHSFLAGFHQTLGMPLSGSDSAIFFGNYRYTPFGIHKDELHVFYFVVEGKKTMSMWPFEALSHREEVPKDPGFIHRPGGIQVRDTAEEKQLLAQASFLEGRAGDLLYWPDSYWHRAEPSEGLSVSASLGVGTSPPEFTMMGAPGEWPARLRPSELPGARGWQPPAALRQALQQH
ncbi:MAG TPA: cupin-like domain-containing protein, partial [Archangium sp.]|nr:cupin-like domain-containing protein [Archangium sp.]